MSSSSPWQALRSAQERRSKAYAEWDKVFKRAVGGVTSPEDFGAVAGVVTTELGAVSTALRSLQSSLLEQGDPQASTISAVVERLQAAEKVRYEATVDLQRNLAVHVNQLVIHDRECIATQFNAGLRTGVGSSGFDASDSDDETDEAHAHHGGSGPHRGGCNHRHDDELSGTRQSNGCASLSEKVRGLQSRLSQATEDVCDIVAEIQCELSG
jgi:hypothetical protein